MIQPTMAAQHHIARFFWQAFDCIAGAVTLAWLSLLDRICGREPPTPVDAKRATDRERRQGL
jgi:hypothetical protein